MKTQIQFTQSDGDNGVALVVGSITSLEQAKRELAAKLDLPDADTPDQSLQDIDARLRKGGIDPSSVTFDQIAE